MIHALMAVIHDGVQIHSGPTSEAWYRNITPSPAAARRLIRLTSCCRSD